MPDKLDNVPPPHDAPEGWEGPPILAARPLRARGPQGRPANRRPPRGTRRPGPGTRQGAGARDHRRPRPGRPVHRGGHRRGDLRSAQADSPGAWPEVWRWVAGVDALARAAARRGVDPPTARGP